MDTEQLGSSPNNASPPPGIINAEEVGKIYKCVGESVIALRGVNLTVEAGDFVVVVGPSGSGKSTLLHILGGVDKPTSGSLFVNGVDLPAASERKLTTFRRDNIGFVFQSYNLLPSLNALDNAILPLLARGMKWVEARERGLNMIHQVGLGHRKKHKPAELSGGEQQRVAIARAMVVEPCVILADEPTGDLDGSTAADIIQLMSDLNHTMGITFVVATHNLNLLKVATHSYELNDGVLISRNRD